MKWHIVCTGAAMQTRSAWGFFAAVVLAAAVGCSDDASRGSDDGGDGQSDAGAGGAGGHSTGSAMGGEGTGATSGGGVDLFPSRVPDGFVLHDRGMVPTSAGETETLTFTATAQTRAFHIVAVADTDTFVVVVEATAPDGTVFIRKTPPANLDPKADTYYAGLPGPGTSPNRATPRPGGAAALIPNTPALAMQPGDWTFRVGAYHLQFDAAVGAYENVGLDTTVHVGVLERVVDPPAGGAIDLALSFAPSSGLTAATAKDDAGIQGALAQIATSLGSIGVEVGSVIYQDAPAVPAKVDMAGPSCLGGPSSLAALASAPDAAPRAIRIVFTERFECLVDGFDAGQFLAGISNGIPGIPFALDDGIIVSTQLKEAEPEAWALVMAHELGHYLGLSHTCEAIDVCDNVADTSEAEPNHNLMYFNVSANDSDALTPDQGQIVRLSPLVY